jgi:hypothetical protein
VRSAISPCTGRNGIQRTRQQEHGTDKSGGNAEDISIEKHHVQHDVIKNDVAGGITHTVANLLFYGQYVAHLFYPHAVGGAETGFSFLNHCFRSGYCVFWLADYVSCFL